MASPLQTGKQSVNLATPVRVSRIRREPPPPVKTLVVRDPEERDRRVVIIGVVAFALAIAVLIVAFGSYSTWSPSQYTIEM